MTIKTLKATEYITPLREGGSLPAIIRADDGELYVMKFIGAGQGQKSLIAELICGELARVLGFNMPEVPLIELDPAIGKTEPDAEIQDLLHASVGLNLGLKFLPHSVSFNPLVPPPPSAALASQLVWFDAFVTNVDRTPRNVNLLVHDGEIWLIDHGACLYFHHSWGDYIQQSETKFPMIRDHVLLPLADQVVQIDSEMKRQLSRDCFEHIVAQIPDHWLMSEAQFETPAQHRAAYVAFLEHRLSVSHLFVEEANRARASLL